MYIYGVKNRFKAHIESHFPFLRESKLLIAISGGLDSVVLAHLCHHLGLNLALAHCNFNLRGQESDGDEDFVNKLAENLDVELFIESFDTVGYANEHKQSTQMAARELRYNWFDELAEQLKFDFILTAHHADDNLETFLINLSRGTGLEGLKGIPEINNNIVRPFLKFSREDILMYAETENLKWREDSSNASTKYLRNKLRHDVIPQLKTINPQFLGNFQTTLSNLDETAGIVQESISRISKNAIKESNNNRILFAISEFVKLNNPKAYLYEIFKSYGFTEWNDVYNLLEAQSGKQVFSETHRLLKDREYLILSDLASEKKQEDIFINSEEKEVKTALGTLHFSETDVIENLSNQAVYIDKEKLKFPIVVRQWQNGDYFYPFGMRGKKKLSKFFKDEKLSLLDKENCLLLCSENEIIWVINHRLDDRFKVTNTTNKILKITLQQ